MTALVVQGDARRLPLPDGSVDLIVTSPPYFALRSYTDAGTHYQGQIGSEATPAEWLEVMWQCTAEMVRVLKPVGSIFVDLRDKYGPDKGLMFLPERYRIGCVDRLGLIGRSVIIWSKPNGLPESVTDRVRYSHEDFVHLVKQPRYYAAVDEIREATPQVERRPKSVLKGPHLGAHGTIGHDGRGKRFPEDYNNPLGKLPGSVWQIPSEPLTVPASVGVDHFAAFPTEWPRRLILGWSPPGICTACGQGRRPVVDKELVNVWHDKPPVNSRYVDQEAAHLNNRKHGDDRMMRTFGSTRASIIGYECGCETMWLTDAVQPSTRPALVLDPFGGTGTTALVAHALGRVGITVDMSGDYSRLAKWRTTDRGELAKAMRVPKPAPVPNGQMEMFA